MPITFGHKVDGNRLASGQLGIEHDLGVREGGGQRAIVHRQLKRLLFRLYFRFSVNRNLPSIGINFLNEWLRLGVFAYYRFTSLHLHIRLSRHRLTATD